MEKGIIIKGEIITKNYKFNGEIKDNLPYNGEIKDVKEIILESYDKHYKIKEFKGLIKEGKAYSGTGKIESRIDYGIIIDSERLEDQNQEYFKEDVYIEDEIPKEVKEEIYLNEKYEDLKRRYDFILVESKLYLKDGIVLKTEEYNYHGMTEINSWKYEFIG
ncbi:hypothetical protein [Cetobacterium sp.]|uniref:hypothetical protein n=1 Tax=Cetobacterium sp. TaxID=2071632 RepID=UPI003EE6E695